MVCQYVILPQLLRYISHDTLDLEVGRISEEKIRGTKLHIFELIGSVSLSYFFLKVEQKQDYVRS